MGIYLRYVQHVINDPLSLAEQWKAWCFIGLPLLLVFYAGAILLLRLSTRKDD